MRAAGAQDGSGACGGGAVGPENVQRVFQGNTMQMLDEQGTCWQALLQQQVLGREVERGARTCGQFSLRCAHLCSLGTAVLFLPALQTLLEWDDEGSLLATASKKGTVVRVHAVGWQGRGECLGARRLGTGRALLFSAAGAPTERWASVGPAQHQREWSPRREDGAALLYSRLRALPLVPS